MNAIYGNSIFGGLLRDQRGRSRGSKNGTGKFPKRACAAGCGAMGYGIRCRSCHTAHMAAHPEIYGTSRKGVACVECGVRRDQTGLVAMRCRECWQAKAKRDSLLRRTKTCPRCGEGFTFALGADKTYCGRSCAALARCERGIKPPRSKPRSDTADGPHCKVYFLRCGGCERAFIARSTRAAGHCGRLDCVNAVRMLRKRGPLVPRKCKECGEEYAPKSLRQSVFCSAACSRSGGKSSSNGMTYRQRAARFGVAYEPVGRLKVFIRDGWRCMICGGKILRRKNPNHPKAPSLDHRVPMSRGGSHTYANVQCAHRQCNSIKSANNSRGQLPIWER
jgi:5-methylcytosine-specific restriction endonuclease McrA/ribosomal protein S27AE